MQVTFISGDAGSCSKVIDVQGLAIVKRNFKYQFILHNYLKKTLI